MAWDVYRNDDASVWYMDTYKAERKQEWPFTSMAPIKDFPLELPDELVALTRVYATLKNKNNFKRGFVNINLFISKTLQQQVCSFCSDDDGLDFVCISQNGVLQRLRCECDDIEITYENRSVTIQPLQPEVDDNNLTDLSQLHDPDAGISVMERNKAQSPHLHPLASLELTAFLGTTTAPLGLGSFDGLATAPFKVASSKSSAIDALPSTNVKPWWKFWG
jgi:hypothetical protein